MSRITKACAVACGVAVGLLALVPQTTRAPTKAEIDVSAQEAMKRFYNEVNGSKERMGKASGALVFPRVFRAGMGVGGSLARALC